MKSFINKFKKARPSTSKGYTLLLAVIVSVMVLSIAAFILSVSRKQEILSASARDSMYAFYSADSALECAVENLDNLKTQTPASISCGANNGNNKITVNSSGNGPTAGTSTFSMLTGTGSKFTGTNDQSNQSGAASCASTSVSYVVDTATGATTTTVIVNGYNIGWSTNGNSSNNGDCTLPGPRKVERVLQYTQY